MMKLQASDWLAVAALFVSIVSLGISLYATLLDRIKVMTTGIAGGLIM